MFASLRERWWKHLFVFLFFCSAFFACIVYVICHFNSFFFFSSFLSIISRPLFLYVAVYMGLMLENEWKFCHIRSAVHLTLGALLNGSHCFPMNTRIRVKPFYFVWVAWGSFESSVLRLIIWSSGSCMSLSGCMIV